MDTNTSQSSDDSDWPHLQKQYWETWLNFSRQLLDLSPTHQSAEQLIQAWTTFFSTSWQNFVDQVPKEYQPILKKIFEESQQYFSFNQQLLELLKKLPTIELNDENWQTQWANNFSQLKQYLLDFLDEFITPQWKAPLKNGSQFAHLFALMPTNPLANLYSNHAVPWQIRAEETKQLAATYQQAYQEYIEFFNQINLKSIELLGQKLKHLLQTGQSIEKLRTFYDLWVDCWEQAYAEHAFTEKYAEINANLLNTFVAWKSSEQQASDEILTTLHLPTYQEFSTVTLRMQQLRRELRIFQSKQNDNTATTILQKEIAELRTAFEKLQSSQAKINKLQS